MTSNQFNAALAKLDLTQVAAARLLGVDPRTARHYAAGTRSVPVTVAMLLRLLLRGRITAADIERAKTERTFI